MAREIFNPNLALFVCVPEGGTTFQPNPNSVVQNDTGVSHLEFFKFVGRVVGKALYDGQLMDAYFTRSFYKHMLGQPLTYEVSSRGASEQPLAGRAKTWCQDCCPQIRIITPMTTIINPTVCSGCCGVDISALRPDKVRDAAATSGHGDSTDTTTLQMDGDLSRVDTSSMHSSVEWYAHICCQVVSTVSSSLPAGPVCLQDIEAVDPEYYKNLKWMLENDITDVLDLTFAAESDFFGKTEVLELVPGGRDIKVTEANKREYVNLIARHRMTTSIKAQIHVRQHEGDICACVFSCRGVGGRGNTHMCPCADA